VTPTLKQRLGLAPVRLSQSGRARLLAAQAGIGLFAGHATLTVAVGLVGGRMGVASLLSAAGGFACAGFILLRYDRLRTVGSHGLVLASNALLTVLVVAYGPTYAPAYLSLALYVAFFHERRAAFVHVGLAAAISAVALRHHLDAWLLSTGIAAGGAAFVSILRARLLDVAQIARGHRATFDAFFHNAPIGLAYLDADLRHVRVNEALVELTGRAAEEYVGRTVGEVDPDDAETLEPRLRDVLETGEPFVGYPVAGDDGRHFLASYYPVHGAGKIVGLGASLVDVTELREAEARMAVLATTDPLTGLPNRRFLVEQLDLALARARRHGTGVALLSVDLDRFKEVNDTLGHAFGDGVLAEVSKRLRAGARGTDVVARMGGDEFVVLLADLDLDEAKEIAAGVRHRILDELGHVVPVGPVEVRVPASVGVALYPDEAADADGLLALADRAMYHRKRETRAA
jgi:diguanylate cyclase (GGDEF)-like protein/PAS domain S-box-containing protein